MQKSLDFGTESKLHDFYKIAVQMRKFKDVNKSRLFIYFILKYVLS
jgi:hypothetical protein